jgi:hypothetical protein
MPVNNSPREVTLCQEQLAVSDALYQAAAQEGWTGLLSWGEGSAVF